MRTNQELCPATDYLKHITLRTESYERASPMQTMQTGLLEEWRPASTPPYGLLPFVNFREYTPEQNGEPMAVTNPQVKSPLPGLSWANSEDLWWKLKSTDSFKLEPEILLKQRHPCVTPHMRSILLDWMQEVCEVYRLHRETYFLALDLYDRYMESQIGISKDTLQKIGITCLFAAAKIEEIYPPKVKEFAYVTDGACMVSDILDEELKIYKALNWKLSRCYTVNNWVNTLMQLGDNVSRSKSPPVYTTYPAEFTFPHYSPMDFVKVMSLLDLCTLDISNRAFSSSILSATAMYLVLDSCRKSFPIITGIDLKDIWECLHWMTPFWNVLKCGKKVVLKEFHGPPEVMEKDSHNIQTHVVSLQMLDTVLKSKKQPDVISRQLFPRASPLSNGIQYLPTLNVNIPV